MHRMKYTALGLLLLLVIGCGDDSEVKPVVIPMTLHIPGVDSAAVIPEKLPAQQHNVERNLLPLEITGNTLIPTVDVPAPLLLDTLLQRRFATIQSDGNRLPVLNTVFYPLGWSADGKFAYAIESPDEVAGRYLVSIYIQDLVTDHVLWKQAYQSEPKSTVDAQNFAAYWMMKEGVINAQLEKYAIVKNKRTDLMGGPIDYEKDQLNYDVQKTLAGQSSVDEAPMVTQYQISVHSTTRGSKIVHTDTYKKPFNVRDIDVLGYLQGLDTQRIALLVSGIRQGPENAADVTWFKVIGTNLRRGFK